MKPNRELNIDEQRFILRLYFMKFTVKRISFCLNRLEPTIKSFLDRKNLQY